MKGYFGKLQPSRDSETCIYFVTDGEAVIGDISLSVGTGVCVSGDVYPAGNAEGLTVKAKRAECENVLHNIFGNRSDQKFSFNASEAFISDCLHFFGREGADISDTLYADGVLRILLSSARSSEASNKTYVSTIEKHVLFAENYIKANMDKKIRMDDLAARMGVSRAYLRNIFFESKGASPQEYLSQCRIEKAKELLSQTDMGVGKIGSAVGYSDPLAFSKFFKTHVGASPNKYRAGDNSSESEVMEAPAKIEIKEEKTYDNYINKAEEDIDITYEIEKAIAEAARAEKEREESEINALNSPVWLL